jgi:hypothetical protein
MMMNFEFQESYEMEEQVESERGSPWNTVGTFVDMDMKLGNL